MGKKNGVIQIPQIAENELDKIGEVEVCCQYCKRTIIRWSPWRETTLGRAYLDNAIKLHRCE
jgi:hypothetical protein